VRPKPDTAFGARADRLGHPFARICAPAAATVMHVVVITAVLSAGTPRST
jgi:L-asparagine transporter-like permease